MSSEKSKTGLRSNLLYVFTGYKTSFSIDALTQTKIKGRSLDKTPIVLVSLLIPTLPVELLQVPNY